MISSSEGWQDASYLAFEPACRAPCVCSNNICWISGHVLWNRWLFSWHHKLFKPPHLNNVNTFWKACLSPHVSIGRWFYPPCLIFVFWEQWLCLGTKMVARNIRTCISSTCACGFTCVCLYWGRRKGAPQNVAARRSLGNSSYERRWDGLAQGLCSWDKPSCKVPPVFL